MKNLNTSLPVCKQPGLVMFLFLFGILATMSVLKYDHLYSTYYDLGVFLNNFTLFSRGDWSRVFMIHLQPFVVLWSIYFYILPGELAAIFIIGTQSALLALPALKLYKHYGFVPALGYCLYFPIWYNALSDFHMDHMVIPITFAFFFFEKQQKWGWAVLMAVLLAFVKEVFALQTIFCGLYLWWIRKRRLAGLSLAVFGAVYFFFAIEYVQKYFLFNMFYVADGLDAFSPVNPAYAWLGSSLSEVVGSLVLKPHTVALEIISNKEKMLFCVYTLGALGFFPLLRLGILLVAVPIFAMVLLSDHPNHYVYVHHYTAGLVAPLVLAFAEGLPRAEKVWNRITSRANLFPPLLIAGLFIVHGLLSPSPLGRKFYGEKAWNYHYSIYFSDDRVEMIKQAIKKFIPDDPSVRVSTQNTLNWDYLTRRPDIFVFPNGATQSAYLVSSSRKSWSGFKEFVLTGSMNLDKPQQEWADFVVLDLRRPWFIGDIGCHWISGHCQGDPVFSRKFMELVGQARNNFKTVFEEDGFMILKR